MQAVIDGSSRAEVGLMNPRKLSTNLVTFVKLFEIWQQGFEQLGIVEDVIILL